MRLIDADALMELYADRLIAVAERYSPDSSECGILSGAMKLLEIQPTIEERKTGKWIWKTEDKYECSYCHEIITVKEVMNIPQYITCPMCDAKMEGERDGI